MTPHVKKLKLKLQRKQEITREKKAECESFRETSN